MKDFDNDNATQEERAMYLTERGFHIEEVGSDDDDYEATLHYPKGQPQVLDARTTADAYFEACNIVKG